jgi:hypothetical protein
MQERIVKTSAIKLYLLYVSGGKTKTPMSHSIRSEINHYIHYPQILTDRQRGDTLEPCALHLQLASLGAEGSSGYTDVHTRSEEVFTGRSQEQQRRRA